MHIWTYIKHIHTHIRVYTYIHAPTRTDFIYRHINKIAHTHFKSLPILLHLHVCIGIIIHKIFKIKTFRQDFQFDISPSHSIPTPG